MSDWNPRYLAYVRSQGSLSPEEQMKADRERWPGGPMSGYILWISEQWRAWREERGIRPDEPISDLDHADFDMWFAGRVNRMEAAG